MTNPDVWLLTGDALTRLHDLPGNSVHLCVTSPPYYGLRSYQTETWNGGDPACTHNVRRWEGPKQTQGTQSGHASKADSLSRDTCKCGAIRTDMQIGHEKTPKDYVANLTNVFREVRRILRDDGSLWIVIGDCYARDSTVKWDNSIHRDAGWKTGQAQRDAPNATKNGYKPKDLLGIPWMLAFSLRDDGWFLREEIVWQKPSCLPESVRDRSTRQHETIFHLTKSPRYFHDWFAIAEPAVSDHPSGNGYKREARLSYSDANGTRGDDKQWNGIGGLRNARSVWTINPEASRLKQFAMFPTRLASRVIRASTSDGGCCASCGAQYLREIGTFEADEAWKKASGADASGGYAGTAVKDYGDAKAQDASATKARILAGMKRKETIGWTKGCACPEDGRPPIPATVLDPFSGAGTSMLSATRLGRCSIGIDLNPGYQNIAAGRITDATAKCLDGDGKRLPFIAGDVWRA